jgi:hypothetical protein
MGRKHEGEFRIPTWAGLVVIACAAVAIVLALLKARPTGG